MATSRLTASGLGSARINSLTKTGTMNSGATQPAATISSRNRVPNCGSAASKYWWSAAHRSAVMSRILQVAPETARVGKAKISSKRGAASRGRMASARSLESIVINMAGSPLRRAGSAAISPAKSPAATAAKATSVAAGTSLGSSVKTCFAKAADSPWEWTILY